MQEPETFTGRVHAQIKPGCWMIEQDLTRDGIFCHQRNVIKNKFLRPNDRVRFRLVPSERKPGTDEAVDVELIGHTINRQVSTERTNGGAL